MDSDRRDHPSRGRSGSGLTARPLPPVVGAQAVLETDEAKVCVCARGVLRHDTGDGTVCRCRDTAIRNAPGTRSNTAERTEGADAFGAVGHSAELWCCCVCAGCVVDRCVGHSSRHTTRPAPNITMSCLAKSIVCGTPLTQCSPAVDHGGRNHKGLVFGRTLSQTLSPVWLTADTVFSDAVRVLCACPGRLPPSFGAQAVPEIDEAKACARAFAEEFAHFLCRCL